MRKKGHLYTGTVRQNRLPGGKTKEEKELKKAGHGSYDYRVETSENVAAVRWYDNKAVTLLSTEVSIDPMKEAKRDKKAKNHANVPMPAIINRYNKHMGGIDILNSFLALYRFRIQCKPWYLYLYWHFLMVALVNAWVLYRREYMMQRRQFQVQLAAALVKVNVGKRKGRPSNTCDASTPPARTNSLTDL